MPWTLRHAHWTLVVTSTLLLTLALPASCRRQSEDKAEDSCLLPYLGPTRGGHPAQELSRIAAVDYKDCLHQCCHSTDDQCNVLLFSLPDNSAEGSADSSCVLLHCQNMSSCNISTRPGDQVFAEAQFVRLLLINTFNGHHSATGKAPPPPPSPSAAAAATTSPPQHRDVTLAATKTPASSDHSVPVKAGSRDSLTASTPHADKTLSRSGGLKDTEDPGGNTTRESTAAESGDAQPGAATHQNSLVTPVAGITEPQSGSGKMDGMTAKLPSSETSPPKANTGVENVTQTSLLSSSKLTGNDKTGTSGVQSSTKQSGINNAHHTVQPILAEAAIPKANSLTKSANGSSSHSSATLNKTISAVSGLTVAQTARQTTPPAQKNPASSVTGKPGLLKEVTLTPGGSTPQENVAQTTQRKTNATTLPAQSGSSSLHPNSTSVPKSHPTGSPSAVHNATTPGTSATQSAGTSPSSGHVVSNSTSGKGGSSSAKPGTSSKPTNQVTGGDVTKMASTERTPFWHNGTAPNASLVLGQLSDNGNYTSTWQNVMADQSMTTMAILISALTLGCIFLLVTMVIVGKRLVDCWRNRKYSQINRDYLIDGMYDE